MTGLNIVQLQSLLHINNKLMFPDTVISNFISDNKCLLFFQAPKSAPP